MGKKKDIISSGTNTTNFHSTVDGTGSSETYHLTTTVTPTKNITVIPSKGTTSYSVDASFCNVCGGELPNVCECCDGKLSLEKALEIHNKKSHSE